MAEADVDWRRWLFDRAERRSVVAARRPRAGLLAIRLVVTAEALPKRRKKLMT
jgi:hypothetical protein